MNNFTWGNQTPRFQEPLNTALCTTIKAHGIKIAVLYTTYLAQLKMTQLISAIKLRLLAPAASFAKDARGLAAVEFAMILPIMLVLFFGTVEISNGVAVYRNVTLMAHTLSDLTSQSTSVQDSDLSNFFAASTGVMTPYSATPSSQTITEIWINSSLQPRVQWSSGPAARSVGAVVTVPSTLKVANTYVIYSQVSYLYTPAVGYIMSGAGVTLSDFAYTRPRQSTCVLYDSQTACPTS